MIFPTLEEANRVYDIVEKRGNFDDLTEVQMATIKGMYWSIEELESLVSEADNNTEITVIEECIETLERTIIDLYVSYSDTNTNLEDEK